MLAGEKHPLNLIRVMLAKGSIGYLMLLVCLIPSLPVLSIIKTVKEYHERQSEIPVRHGRG